ncbi:MAG: hypothetical protein ACR2MY_15195 [Candidatus Dormibacteria bacterium]
MDAEPNYPWIVAMGTARRRLNRLKTAVAVGGTLLLAAVAALAAAASPAPPAPAAAAGSAGVDVFGQSVQPGPDNLPPGPGATGGDNLGQGAPSIVTAPS